MKDKSNIIRSDAIPKLRFKKWVWTTDMTLFQYHQYCKANDSTYMKWLFPSADNIGDWVHGMTKGQQDAVKEFEEKIKDE